LKFNPLCIIFTRNSTIVISSCIISGIIRRKKEIIIFLLLFAFPILNAQYSSEDRDNFLFGEYYLEAGLYADALDFYYLVHKNHPENANFNYRMGQCYLNIPGDEAGALPFLEKAVKEINQNYVAGKLKRPGAPAEAWLLLGDAYYWNDDLSKAKEAYLKYKELSSGNKKDLELAEQRVRQLNTAEKYNDTAFEIEEYNLGHEINSKYDDYYPVISGDGNTLVYTSYRAPLEKIYLSEREGDEWTRPKDITRQTGSDGDCYSAALNYYGDELYLIRQMRRSSDIYVSTLKKGRWTRMKKLNKQINSRNFETSLCLSRDGNTMYFSSDRKKGVGGFDLYKASRNDKEWDNVENLGNIINTELNEEFPSLVDDDKTLFFSSQGHENMGGMDIFYSERNGVSNWATPQNAGPPLNTIGHDIYVSFTRDGKSAYSSQTGEEGYGRSDLYRIDFPEPVKLTERLQKREEALALAQEKEALKKEINEELNKDLNEDMNDELNDKYSMEEEAINTKYLKKDASYQQEPKAEEITPSWTVQVMALYDPVESDFFSDLNEVKVSKGDDGFYRYTCGEYIEYNKAVKKMKEFIRMGYRDAFIRELRTVQNYFRQ